MAFKELIFTVITQPGVSTGVKAGLRKMGRGVAPAKLVINLSTQRAAELGFAAGDKAQVMIGDGSDFGLIRIRKNNSAPGAFAFKAKKSQKGTWFEINLGVVEGYPDRSESARWCKISPSAEGYFEIEMPSWARKPVAPATTQPVIQPRPHAAMADKLAMQRARELAPAPSFSAKEKPSRKEALDRIGKIGSGT